MDPAEVSRLSLIDYEGGRASDFSESNFPRRGKLGVPAKHNPERGYLSGEKNFTTLHQ